MLEISLRLPRLLPLFLVAGLLALSTSLAAAPHWAPLGPYGGFVDSLTVDPVQPQVLYTTADLRGTFKSVNSGASWTLIHAGIASGNVAVDPSRHTTIYQSLNFNQVLKSTDGGATWSSSNRGLPNVVVTLLAVDPAMRTRVYVAGDGVWHSLDGGFSWKSPRRPVPQGAARHVLALAVARRPAGTIYAATGAGVFKSLDAGDSWKPASRGLPAGEVTALAMAPSNPQILWAGAGKAVFRSTNGGATWSPAAGLPEAGEGVISLAVAAGDPSAAWVGTFGHGAYRTTDAGAHWTPAGLRTTSRVAALAAIATLYAAVVPGFRDPGGVLASGDGGGSWQPRNTGLFALDIPAVAIDPHHPEILWAAAGAPGLYRSTAGGQMWDLPPQPPAPADPNSLPSVNDVAFSADGALLYTLFNQALWRSGDAGGSWQLSLGPGTTPPSTTVFFFLTHPVDAATVYAWSAPNLYASHDSGATWQTLSPPGPTCFFEALAVAPSAPATLYAGGANDNHGPFFCRNTRSSLARSNDGGASWAAADGGLGGVGVDSLAVDPLDPRTIYAQTHEALVTPAGVWKSTDGGATWLRTGNLTVEGLVFSAGGGTLWGVHGTQVFASRDGAASWQSVGGPQAFAIFRIVPDPIDPDRLYAATSESRPDFRC